jgi:hypothetical protein
MKLIHLVIAAILDGDGGVTHNFKR